MSESSVVQKEISDIAIIEAVPSGLREFLQAAVGVNEKGIYCDPECQFCTSPHREEAETLWRNSDPKDKDRIDKVISSLASHSLVLSREVVTNHIRTHMGAGEAEIRKLEYIRKLNSMGSVRITTLDRLQFVMDAVSERIAASAAISENETLSKADAEQMKSNIVNALSKTSAALFNLHLQMEKDLEASGDMIRIHKDSFKKAFDSAISSAKNERERQLIGDLLNELMGSLVA